MKTASKVIVALDVETADEARSIVSELSGEPAAFKIGLQLFTAAGPGLVREIAAKHRVFLDLKFHDIPNTVAKAAVETARLGVWMFNVHTLGGSEMMRRTVEEVESVCPREGLRRPLIIGVTVLTSSDANTLAEIGIESETAAQVAKLAGLAEAAGLEGVVASPQDVTAIRSAVSDANFTVVTPGVRPEFATNDDQKRVMTPRRAVSEGSDYLVIGRPILRAENRLEALKRIQKEIDSVEE